MKINIQRISYNGRPDRKGNWWCWTETCDRCGKEIFNNSDQMTMAPPETDEFDFCTDCYKWLMDNKISYKEAEQLYGKDKDVFLDCIEKVKAASGCNDIILVTDTETLKNVDRLYGYKVVHMDNIYNYENFEWMKMNSHQVYIIPRNEPIGIKYKIVFNEEEKEL